MARIGSCPILVVTSAMRTRDQNIDEIIMKIMSLFEKPGYRINFPVWIQ